MEISFQLLQQQNPWWFREELIKEDEKITDYEQETYKYIPSLLEKFPVNKDAILTLRGPRQIGKSTTMKLLIRLLLLEKQLPKKNIFYFSLDRIEDFNQLYELLTCYFRNIRPANAHERLYLFLDEISFVREWQRGIKALADEGRLKNTTLLLTGSNLLDVREGTERLPGRRGKLAKLDYEQLPLTFAEFIQLKEPDIDLANQDSLTFHQDLLLHRFEEFLITGGFPLAINLFYKTGHISSWVYQLYLSWIEGDIGRAGKLERNLYQIMGRILAHQATPVSWLAVGREAGIASHATVREYIEILEKMYVLQVTPFLDLSSQMPRYRKNRKIYFQDPLIFHCFSGKNNGIGDNFYFESKRLLNNPLDKSKLVESVVGSHVKRYFGECFYWQGKKEIDFLIRQQQRLMFIEVKYQEQTKLTNFNWRHSIIPEKNKLLVATKHQLYHGEDISLVPVPIFLIQLSYEQ